jgi:hypothetical protein
MSKLFYENLSSVRGLGGPARDRPPLVRYPLVMRAQRSGLRIDGWTGNGASGFPRIFPSSPTPGKTHPASAAPAQKHIRASR